MTQAQPLSAKMLNFALSQRDNIRFYNAQAKKFPHRAAEYKLWAKRCLRRAQFYFQWARDEYDRECGE